MDMDIPECASTTNTNVPYAVRSHPPTADFVRKWERKGSNLTSQGQKHTVVEQNQLQHSSAHCCRSRVIPLEHVVFLFMKYEEG